MFTTALVSFAIPATIALVGLIALSMWQALTASRY